MVTFLSVLLKLETLSRRVVLALVLALVGSVLLVGLHAPEGTHDDLLLGTLFALRGSHLRGHDRLRALSGGGLPSLAGHGAQFCRRNGPLLINLLSGVIIVHTAQGWLLILYLGLVPTALAYWLFQTGLRTVSATAASIISLLEPSVAALLAWLLFGETLAATGVLGGALLIVSILLLSTKRRRLVTDL